KREATSVARATAPDQPRRVACKAAHRVGRKVAHRVARKVACTRAAAEAPAQKLKRPTTSDRSPAAENSCVPSRVQGDPPSAVSPSWGNSGGSAMATPNTSERLRPAGSPK